jgi:hypothetical protein
MPTAVSTILTNGLQGYTGATGLTGSTGIGSIGATGATGPALGLLSLIIDGGGSPISAGVKGYLEVPFAGTITQWTILNDVSGTIAISLWKDTYANYPPTIADNITGASSAKPLTSAAIKGQSSTLTGWTTSIANGDIIAFSVDATATSVTRSTIALDITKT